MPGSTEFQQRALQFIDPIQHDYEAIRPVIFGTHTLRARSAETDIERTVLGDTARRPSPRLSCVNTRRRCS